MTQQPAESTRLYGCHLSTAGGFVEAARAAISLGVSAIQIHPSAPQRWVSKPFAEGVETEFLSTLKNESYSLKTFMHCIYLINLANIDDQKFHLSKLALVQYLGLADRLNAEGVIFHVGSNTGKLEHQAALERIAKGISWVLKETPAAKKPLLLEVSAGSGNIIGSKMEDLRAIADIVNEPKRVQFALDTQHLWASGYNLKEDLDGVVAQIDKHFGLNNVRCIHLNDSKTECGSKKDRHENLGQGLIGKETMQRIITHKKLAHIPLVMETPDLETPEGAAREVAALRGFLGIN